MTQFPQIPLQVNTQIQLNGVWTDISDYVYQRDDLNITGGQPDESSGAQPAQYTFTVNNRDGRFTPNNTSGLYYPYLARNTPVRLRIEWVQTITTGYGRYTFTGTVSDWPPLSDTTGEDIYVQVTANGVLRQIVTGGGFGSALARYYQSLTGLAAPIAYWPCEEEPNTTQIQSGVNGGMPMTITGTPVWKAVKNGNKMIVAAAVAFNGSAPIGIMNKSTWTGFTGSFGPSGDDIFSTPGTYQWVATTSTVNCKCWGAGGGGENGVHGYSGDGGEFAQETTLAVTPGNYYTVIVGAGGAGGAYSTSQDNAGQPGGDSIFAGDSVTVHAHGGQGDNGPGGTGSTNTVHFNGGSGATTVAHGAPGRGGAGGGSSAGTAAAGNGGNANSGVTGGAGEVAPTGGGAGGTGGTSPSNSGAVPGVSPGGGGGAGCSDTAGGSFHSGQAGGSGKVELVYTPPGAPPANVIRFIMLVPAHGGNNGGILLRVLGNGTIARLDVQYVFGGSGGIRINGYNSSSSLLFSSSTLVLPDGTPVMVSIELTPSGTSTNYKLTAFTPGAYTGLGAITGTQTSATLSSVTEVIAAPNGDITKTAIAHISVQYALIPMFQVANALGGNAGETSIDRLIRLATEQAMAVEPGYNETADHWGFDGWTFTVSGTPASNNYFGLFTSQGAQLRVGQKFTTSVTGSEVFKVTDITLPFAGFVDVFFSPISSTNVGTPATVTSQTATGVQGWTAVSNCTLAQSQVSVTGTYASPSWPKDGSASSLRMDSTGGGVWKCTSPTGTSGQPLLPGDVASVAVDLYAPLALGAVIVNIDYYTSAGVYISSDSSPSQAMTAGQIFTVQVRSASGGAPATTAYCAISIEDNETKASGTFLYIDNVRYSPRMGVQTRKRLQDYIKEVTALEQGLLKESKELVGLGYRTRFSLINQTPALTLDYSLGHLSGQLQPVFDDLLTNTFVVVKRDAGSTIITTTTGTGGGSNIHVTISPNPVYIAETDDQLAALAAHLLNLGTDVSERYPQISVDLSRSELSSLIGQISQVDIGDMIEIINLPFWYPSSTTQQIVIGYTEVVNAFKWQITWNCKPATPWNIAVSSIRRW